MKRLISIAKLFPGGWDDCGRNFPDPQISKSFNSPSSGKSLSFLKVFTPTDNRGGINSHEDIIKEPIKKAHNYGY
jgi:hypothetical protein